MFYKRMVGLALVSSLSIVGLAALAQLSATQDVTPDWVKATTQYGQYSWKGATSRQSAYDIEQSRHAYVQDAINKRRNFIDKKWNIDCDYCHEMETQSERENCLKEHEKEMQEALKVAEEASKLERSLDEKIRDSISRFWDRQRNDSSQKNRIDGRDGVPFSNKVPKPNKEINYPFRFNHNGDPEVKVNGQWVPAKQDRIGHWVPVR